MRQRKVCSPVTAPITIRRSSDLSGRLDESVRPTGVHGSVRVDRARCSRRPIRLAAALTAIGAVTVVVVAAVGGMAWASSPKSAAGTLNPPPAPSYALGKLVSPYNVPMSDPSVMVGNGTDYLYTGAGGYEPRTSRSGRSLTSSTSETGWTQCLRYRPGPPAGRRPQMSATSTGDT